MITVLRSGDLIRIISGDFDRAVPAQDIHFVSRGGRQALRVYENGTMIQELLVPLGDEGIQDDDGVLFGIGVREVTIAENQSVFINTDNATGDAFGRLRVSEPQALHDGKNIFGDDQKYWSNSVSTGGMFSGPSTILPIGATGAIKLKANSDAPGPKFPEWYLGLGVSFVDGRPTSGMGMGFDATNGRHFWIKRPSVSAKIIKNADWSIDPMDGTGPSGITIDWSKPQIFDMDFEWLGAGRIRFGFNIDGKTYYAHRENVANRYDASIVPYIPNPNMRVFYSIVLVDVNTGDTSFAVRATRQVFPYQAGRSQRLFATGIFPDYNAPAAEYTITQICSSVHSESGSTFLGGRRMLRREVVASGVGTGFVSVLAARIAADKIGTIVNYLGGGVFTTDNVSFEYVIALNPTVAAGTQTWVPVTGSNLEQSININNAVTNVGLIIGGGFGSSTAQSRQFAADEYMSSLKLGHAANNTNTPDEIHVLVRTLSSTAAFWSHMDLEEGY